MPSFRPIPSTDLSVARALARRPGARFGQVSAVDATWRWGAAPANGGGNRRLPPSATCDRGFAPGVNLLVTAVRRIGSTCCERAHALGWFLPDSRPGTVTDPNETTDHEGCRLLARRAREGDAIAVEWLVERLSRVPAFLRARNSRSQSPLSPDELNDVIQETLTSIWTRLDRFEGRASFDTWICGFAVNQYRKHLERRRNSRKVADVDTLADSEPAPEPDQPTLDRDVIEQAIDQVGPPASDVIRMRHFDDLPFEEISRRTGANENTVKARYYRGLARMRDLLDSHWRRSIS